MSLHVETRALLSNGRLHPATEKRRLEDRRSVPSVSNGRSNWGVLQLLKPIAQYGMTILSSALILLPTAGCDRTSKPNAANSPGLSSDSKAPKGTITSGEFEDVTDKAGIHFVHQLADGKLDNIMESDGAGGVCFDFDRDGFIDIYLVNSGPAPVLSKAPRGTARQPNRLYRNRQNGTFEDVTERAGVAGHGFGTTATAADYDNDGFPDLLVVNFDGLILFHNEGNGTFSDATLKAGLLSNRAGISATFFDCDQDGYLDVFVANYLLYDPAVQNPPGAKAPYPGPLSYNSEFNILYRNRGDGSFEDFSEAANIRIPGHRAMAVTALDVDLDGDSDLYVCNDGTANLLLLNDGHGHFSESGLKAGVGLNQFGGADGSMGAAVGDCNGDGYPDLFVTRFGKASLYINSPGGFFDDRIQPAGILALSSQYTGWGGNFLDADNNGTLDLFVANGNAHFLEGMPPLLFENLGTGTFTDASTLGGRVFKQSLNARGSAALDFDNDGRIDLLVTTLAGPTFLWRNALSTSNHWVTLTLEGAQGNRDGLGALVTVQAGSLIQHAEMRCATSYVTQQDGRLHFGLGSHTVADRVDVRWPGGKTSMFKMVAADQIHKVVEPGESRWRKKAP